LRRGRAERAALERLGVARPELDDSSLARIEELAGVATMRALFGEQLRSLSLEHQEALRLRVVEERSYPEVAAQLGVCEQTARARVSRALRARYVGVYDTRGSGLTIGIGRIYAMHAIVDRGATLYRARLR
jgi:RNA polymerase sigma-70 factor (ECF subfamily)